MATDNDSYSLLSLARHEAGHAVAGHLLGATIESATIVPTADYLGIVKVGELPFPSLNGQLDRDERRTLVNKRIRASMMIDLAGRAAESLWLTHFERRLSDEFDEVWSQRPQGPGCWSSSWSSSDVSSFWSQSDMSRAIWKSLDILGGVGEEDGKAYVTAVFRQVRALLRLDKNQIVVSELAVRLMLAHEMSGIEVTAFLQTVLRRPRLLRRPPRTEAEIAQQRAESEWIRAGESALAGWLADARGYVDDED